ncbi:MAG: hypothetical protein LBN07_00950 [Christensenellaceae bacterium]|jgi:hypothetical protein|nr:hypothetical protein [Christensenellaceae bacterium]
MEERDIEEEFTLADILNAYININPRQLSETEIQVLIEDFEAIKSGELDVPSELLYDFFAFGKLVPSRHTTFADDIASKYPAERFLRVLEIGAGKQCLLSKTLVKKGYYVTSMDPQILIDENRAAKKGFIVTKDYFRCDEFSPDSIGTDISSYDLIVAQQPCGATEHIIRQCLKNNKPFEIKLCGDAHPHLSGEEDDTLEEWYNYLSSIEGTYIDKNTYQASNKKFQQVQTQIDEPAAHTLNDILENHF